MRVLSCHNYYTQRGGEDVIFEDEMELLHANGHVVVPYVEHNNRAETMSGPAIAAETIWSRSARRAFSGVLREAKPEVVHFHNLFFRLSPSAYQSCVDNKIPVVHTLLNYRMVCPAATLFRDGHICEECLTSGALAPSIVHGCYHGSRAQTGVAAAMANVQRWLAVSRSAVDLFITATEFSRNKHVEGGIPADRIRVKPNFIHRDPGGRLRDEGYMVFIGRLVREKGLPGLVEAWRKLHGTRLKIVGSGPLAESIARENNADIDMMGWLERERVIELLKHARCLVLPSEWYEVLPVAIVEAFSCGVPVITNNIGTLAEVVEDGKTGLLCRAGDYSDLVVKVEWARDHPDEMARMGENARREYEEKYTSSRNYAVLMDIYQSAIERNRKKRGSQVPS